MSTIREVGDPVLRTACDPVTTFDERLLRLVADMHATMHAADGVGLAANQIGVALRVFVYDCPDDDGVQHLGTVVNPVLAAVDGDTVTEAEGCLSVPGVHYETPRRARAVVDGQDVEGRPVRVEATGYFARCLQHEVDHLDGRLYLDRLEGQVRRRALRELRARVRQ